MEIRGKVAVVTGARQGLGLALVKTLLAHGAARVFGADVERWDDEVFTPAERARIDWRRCDVTSERDVADLVAAAEGTSLLFSNAGVNRLRGLLSEDGLDAARREIDVNYIGTLRIVRAFVPELRKQCDQSSVILIGSVLAEAPILQLGTYCVSKVAVSAMAEMLRAELSPMSVQVLVAKPGAIDTPMLASLNLPKMTASAAAEEVIAGMLAGAQEVLVGPEARARARAVATDRAAYFRGLGAA